MLWTGSTGRRESSTIAVKPEFAYYFTPSNVVRFGGQAILYDFKPGTAVGISDGEVADISLDDKYALESSIFIEQELEVGYRWSLNYGLRFSHFNYMGPGRAYTFADDPFGPGQIPVDFEDYDNWESIQTYGNLEPRVAARFKVNDVSSIKASYNRTAQYIHLVSNTTASTPLDVVDSKY